MAPPPHVARTAFHLQTITLRSSTSIEQTLHTTAEHPVYVLGKGWIDSGKLAPGDQLHEPDRSSSTILASHKQIHRQGITVYNFRVHRSHTYFVREAGTNVEPVWVHNSYEQIGTRRLPAGRVSSRYQEFVTGKPFEEMWQGPNGRMGVDGRKAGYLVEAKWAGGNDAAFANNDFYNPAGEFYDEANILRQARGYLDMNEANGGNGVRYALSNDAARAHFENLFSQNFPEAMQSGTLQVFHVPANGM